MLDGKTLVCVGGSGGMGRGIAEAAIAAGGKVIVTSRSPDKAREVAREIGCTGLPVDIGDDASVAALFEEVGRFDYLAITAGAVGRSSFSDTPQPDALEFMDGKLWATHRCIWFAKQYLPDDGAITLITGGYASEVSDEAGHVHIAFQAVEALGRVAAVALAPVRCNVIRPGFVDSSMWDFMDDEERGKLRQEEQERALTGRIVSPRDFGEAAIRIMTMSAVTGAVIPVDGGRHLTAR